VIHSGCQRNQISSAALAREPIESGKWFKCFRLEINRPYGRNILQLFRRKFKLNLVVAGDARSKQHFIVTGHRQLALLALGRCQTDCFGGTAGLVIFLNDLPSAGE
jgi:hypothetical protein